MEWGSNVNRSKKNQVCQGDGKEEMNDITLAYNLGGLPEEWLNKVPKSFISLWEKWQDRQSGNSYWENPLHC